MKTQRRTPTVFQRLGVSRAAILERARILVENRSDLSTEEQVAQFLKCHPGIPVEAAKAGMRLAQKEAE